MNVHHTSLETLFAIYHLWRGGLTDPADIGEIVDQPSLNDDSLEEALVRVESLTRGPLQLAQPVRCNYCGGKLTAVPCRTCKPTKPAYHTIDTPVEEPCQDCEPVT